MVDIPPEPEIQDTILSYEEFTQPYLDGVPRWNNLILFFKGDPHYVAKPFYQKLCRENPSLALRIVMFFQGLTYVPRDERSFTPIEPDLYEAYRFMRVAGANNHDLFG